MNKYLTLHLSKYPNMQLDDILKLYMQGILGPGHLVTNFDYALARINEEYLNMNKDNNHNELIEEISDKYVRIYLYPYYQKRHDFTKLINAFIASSKIANDVNEFINEVNKLKNDNNKEYIESYLSSGKYLISHSKEYKECYDPHYLVIYKEYIDLI